jgi:hypothetical protein
MMILLLAALALAQSGPQDKDESVSFTTIDKGTISGFTVPLQMFISSQKEWVEIWTTRQGSATPKRGHPAVDFDRDVVIVAALGTKDSGGYSLEITRIVRTKDDIQIFIRRAAPPDGAKAATVSTSPFVLARMKKPDRMVTFRDEEKK